MLRHSVYAWMLGWICKVIIWILGTRVTTLKIPWISVNVWWNKQLSFNCLIWWEINLIILNTIQILVYMWFYQQQQQQQQQQRLIFCHFHVFVVVVRDQITFFWSLTLLTLTLTFTNSINITAAAIVWSFILITKILLWSLFFLLCLDYFKIFSALLVCRFCICVLSNDLFSNVLNT